jgi:hypothetical protein
VTRAVPEVSLCDHFARLHVQIRGVNARTLHSWLTREALAALPEALVLREVRYRIGMPGFRTREITLVTTLLDAEAYRVSDLAELVPPALAGGNLTGSP